MVENSARLFDYFAVYGLSNEQRFPSKIKEETAAKLSSETYSDFNLIGNITLRLDSDSETEHEFTHSFKLGFYGSSYLFLDVEYNRLNGIDNPSSTGLTICKLEIFYARYKRGYLQIPLDSLKEPLPITESCLSHASRNKKYYKGNFEISPYINQSPRDGYQLIFTVSYSHHCDSPALNDIKFIQTTEEIIEGRRKRVVRKPERYSCIGMPLGVNKDTYICIRKQVSPSKMVFKPELIDRYPLTDHEDSPLTPGIPAFCFNDKLMLYKEHMPPKLFSFVITDGNSIKAPRIYVTCLLFTESLRRSVAKSLYLDTQLFVPKVLCLVSHWPFIDHFKSILKEIYRLHLSTMPYPIERVICNLMDEVYLPNAETLTYNIGSAALEFYRPDNKDYPYVPDICLEYLIRCLSAEDIILVWSAVLLERKVLLVSKHRSLNTYVSIGLAALIFPFKWEHALIPVLPDSLNSIVETFLPYIIGIDPVCLTYDIEVPRDTVIVYLDSACVICHESIPRLPDKMYKKLHSRLAEYKTLFENRDAHLPLCDYPFEYMPIEEECEIDYCVIKDAFLEFLTSLMKDYHKFIEVSKTGNLWFNTTAFLDDFETSDFLTKITETLLFSQLIENSASPEVNYFNNSMKFKRTKKDPLYVKKHIPNDRKEAFQPNLAKLPREAIYSYKRFPRLNPELYEMPRVRPPKVILYRASLLQDDLMCLDHVDWARYLLKSIPIIWLQVFTVHIRQYRAYADSLVLFAIQMMNHAKKMLSKPPEEIFSKLIEVCGIFGLRESMQFLVKRMKHQGLEPNASIYGLYAQAASTNQYPPLPRRRENIEIDLEKCVYMTDNECPYCSHMMIFEDIMSGWEQGFRYETKCPSCNVEFLPKLQVLLNFNVGLSVNLLGPHIIRKELELLVNSDGDSFLLGKDFCENYTCLFWNMNYYFELVKLPNMWMSPSFTEENIIFLMNSLDRSARSTMNSEIFDEFSEYSVDDVTTGDNEIVFDFVKKVTLTSVTDPSDSPRVSSRPLMKTFRPFLRDFKRKNRNKGQLAINDLEKSKLIPS